MTRKTSRKILFTCLTIIFFIVLLQVSFNIFLSRKIKTYFADFSENGKYTIRTGKIKSGLFSRSIHLEKIEFEDNRKSGRIKYLRLYNIRLEGVRFISFLRDDILKMEELKLDEIQLYLDDDVIDGAKKEEEEIKLKLNAVKIRFINLSDTRIIINGNENSSFVSSDNSIRIKDILIDNSSTLPAVFSAGETRIRLEKFSWCFPDSLYTLQGNGVSVSGTDSVFTADSLVLRPNYDRKSFGKALGRQAARVELRASNLIMDRLNLNQLLHQEKLFARRLVGSNFNIRVFLDKNIPFREIRRSSLQEMIREMPIKANIDSIFISEMNILFELLAPNAPEAGKITFDHLKGIITGFCSDKEMLTRKSKLVVNARCFFMNEGRLYAHYEFPLNTNLEEFYCSGSLGSMPITSINPMLQKITSLTVLSGHCDTLSFAFYANPKNSNGWMSFIYKDLNIEIRKKGKNKPRKLLSLFARTFMMRQSNPLPGRAARMAEIKYDRYPYKYFFYYTWKSIQSGLMDAIGSRSEVILKRSDKR